MHGVVVIWHGIDILANSDLQDFILRGAATKKAFHCWTVCFGSGVADGGVVVLLCCCCCFSFLLPFSEMAEAAANDVSSFFLS